ncbi:MAG: cell wall hydrolase [Lachnospiraceae bacterium]|nr:cell wall hydrolase [Lachnospiraceae bacterium]
MNKVKKAAGLLLLLLALMAGTCISAEAKWVKTSSGSYTWYKNGKYYDSTWFNSAKAGFVRIGSKTYCYKLNGAKKKGFMTVDGSRYYMNSSGILIKSKWIIVKGNKYRAAASGKLHLFGVSKVGKYLYGFNKKGVLLYGLRTFNGKTYYLKKKAGGKAAVSAFITIGKKKYYFGKDSVMVKDAWVGKYHMGSTGNMDRSKWIGSRYVGSNGAYLTGLQTLSGKTYYFDEKTGNKLTDTVKQIGSAYYSFGADGVGKVLSSSKVEVESQYYTDPTVTDEVLLAAIIYCEAGNQPYYGQVAVGLVITNRMRSSSFPDTLKEVIYAKQQFEPARTGVLTRLLSNQSMITDSCKKAAALVMKKYRENNYVLDKDITKDGKALSLKDYYFFMTPKAYKRLGMKSAYITLEGHVFFKTWKR